MDTEPGGESSKQRKSPRGKGTGSIESRGKSKWLVRIFLGRDAEGKVLRDTRMIRGNKSDAQAYINGVLRAKDLGQYARPKAGTLKAAQRLGSLLMGD